MNLEEVIANEKKLLSITAQFLREKLYPLLNRVIYALCCLLRHLKMGNHGQKFNQILRD
jgi:hypothetical protein